jgi:hypothetical protein
LIKIIAVLCSLASSSDCRQLVVTTSDFADLSLSSCLMRAVARRMDEAASGRAPRGMSLRDRQTGWQGGLGWSSWLILPARLCHASYSESDPRRSSMRPEGSIAVLAVYQPKEIKMRQNVLSILGVLIIAASTVRWQPQPRVAPERRGEAMRPQFTSFAIPLAPRPRQLLANPVIDSGATKTDLQHRSGPVERRQARTRASSIATKSAPP